MKLDWLRKYFFLLVLALALTVNCESYYSINAPGVIKSNRKYSVVVALLEASEPCSIRIGLEGPNLNAFTDVYLQPFESQIIEFFPKNLQSGKYFLKAEGLTGLSFKNQSRIYEILDEGPKIYIQTDKAVYKPRDLIRFRFVVLDEHTRPMNTADPIRVEILDSQNNRVKQFKNISLTYGTFTGKFQLSKYPINGNWKIRVIIDGTYAHSKYKTFKIDNYILPKFSVHLKAPSSIVLSDGFIKVALYGKYTFGNYVEGYATVELWCDDGNLLLQTQYLEIENLGFVDFNLKTIRGIEENCDLLIKATIREKYTNKIERQHQVIKLRNQRYNLIVPDDDIEFEYNKPYIIKVYVKHWTGAPVLDHKTPVIMKHGNKTYQSLLDASGAATFKFDYDENSDHKFQFKDSTRVFPNIYTDQSLMFNEGEYYCRLNLVDEKLKLGKPILIEVSSIVSIPYLMYQVMGHASLIRHEYISLPPNQKSYIISIMPTIEMIPKSFIYVYYVHRGHLRYEEMILNFPFEFENQISISAPREVRPGEQVTITVNAQPNSFVGLMSVDLGVYLLDNTYDLKKRDILDDMSNEKSYSPAGEFLHPGITSGLVTLSNGHVTLPFSVFPFYAASPGFPVSGSITPEIHRSRQNFPETWIFDNYFINENETKLIMQIPDSVTTWRITAFSNNALTGFGIVNRPTDILTTQPFFISLNLPYAVKRGEIVTISVTIFNYSNQTQDTEVTLKNMEKEFYFMESKREDVKKSNDEQQQIKQIRIETGKGKTVKFLIFPLKAGEIVVRVSATSPSYSDAVLQKLNVEPEGVPKQNNVALYLSIPEGEKISSTFKITDPIESIPDSQYITFSVGGHYLVPTVKNFNNLTQMPTGSGEQNMINFAPSVLILQYLEINGRLTKDKRLVENLLSSIELSYQEQLSFRHDDGGYSVFGMGDDEEPSSWLTAYVVRYFIKASQFLDVETKIIEADLEYLASQQKSSGEFSFTGYLLNPKHKNVYGLTAFILLAFMEDQRYAIKYRNIIENGVEFLNLNLNNVNDINSLCLVAAVMKRVNHHNADILIHQLRSHGKQSKGLRWWSQNDQNPANDIEVTANAALTLLDTPGDHTDILKWLIEQRNVNGGFISC